jgi:hypothetical protein
MPKKPDQEGPIVNSLPLKSIVEHDGRLDILCCLSGGALTIAQIGARTGRGERYVGHHMEVLRSFHLVKPNGKTESGQALYVAKLKEHPPWVAKAVNDHQQAN